MDSNTYVFSSTAEARTCCDSVLSGVTYYENLVSELQNAKTDITQNWEGDANDIASVLASIDDITGKFTTNNAAMKQLAEAMIVCADQTDLISNKELDDDTTIPGDTPEGTPEQKDSAKDSESEKPGFWAWHGGNFAEAWTSQNWGEAWDYSGCDSGLDYVTTTVDAIVDSAGNVVDAVFDTAGAALNFVVDGACEIVGWLF